MGGTAKAGVIRPKGHLHHIEHALLYLSAFNEGLRSLLHGQADRRRVVLGGNNQVYLCDYAAVVSLIMVD